MAGNSSPLTLGDVVTLQRGTTYKSALLGQPGPVLLGLGSIKRNGGFRDDSLKTYGGESPAKLTLHPGDIYVSLKDVTQSADLLGAIARVPPHVHAGRVTQDTVKLTFIRKDVPAGYLYWLMRTPLYREYCRAHAIGTTNLSIAREDFLAFPVPKPKSRELTLVETLDALDDKIELNRRMNATLEAMARALFQSWFVDFDPVRAKLDGRKPVGLDSATSALFPDQLEESPLGHIPKGWKAGKVVEGFNLTMGQSPPGDTYNEDGVGLPFYQGRTDFGFRFPTRRIYCAAPTRYAKPGDTLVSVRAPVGDINMANEECCIGRGVAAVRHKSGATSFTYHSMSNLYPDFARFEAEGTVFGSINKDSFENLRFVIPPTEIVAAYERQAAPLDDQIHILENQSRTLATMRDTLLPKLLSGEITP
jgi:type I restriction enzyme S subunit